MLDFRIDTFLAVCETMNYTRAAEQLNITQPAVSQHIRFLEEAYGTRLFTQQGKRIILTQQGELFRNAILTMKHDELHLKEILQNGQQEIAKVSAGMTMTVGEFAVADKLAEYFRKSPRQNGSIVIANTHELLDQLNRGKIDFAIVEGYFNKKEYDYRIYSKERYIGVCSSKRRLGKKPVSIEELLQERLIIREPGSGTREILEKYLKERNLEIEEFTNRIEISNLNVIKEFVEQDCGITFLYERAVREELRSGRLQELQIEQFQVEHEFTFIWRKGSIFQEYYETLFHELSNETYENPR